MAASAESRGARASIAPLLRAPIRRAVSGAEAGINGLAKRMAAFS
jgi:hypothetical protein